MNLILSTFTGGGLLDRGFTAEGFCVVSAGDKLWGHDIKHFTPARHVFTGVMGGPPCPDFSKGLRTEPTGDGLRNVAQFARVVTEAEPVWFLMENVPGVPTVAVDGYKVQRFNLNASECGVRQNRLRCFQFGSKSGLPLVIHRGERISGASPCCMASEGKRSQRRTWAEFCQLQGLPADFDLPGLSVALRYKIVGNGVPVPMARVLAAAIRAWSVTPANYLLRVCACDCGRPVRPGQTLATAACRKRMQRRRDAAGVTDPGIVTVDRSLPLFNFPPDSLAGATKEKN